MYMSAAFQQTLGMSERGVREYEESGHFDVQARATLGPLECNGWFLAHVKNPRRLHARQQEENMVAGIKKKMIKTGHRQFPILKKRLPVCLRLGNWKQDVTLGVISPKVTSWEFPWHYRYLRKIGLQVLMNELF